MTDLEARGRPVFRDDAAMRDQWTAERVTLLQRLWESGASIGAIAAELGGLSRSAVSGKIYRLQRAAESPAAPKPALQASHQSGKGLLELTNESCRWIVEAAIKWLVTAILSHFQ